MWKPGIMSGHSVRYYLRGLLLAVSLVSALAPVFSQTVNPEQDWEAKYKKLQSEVLKTVPQLESDLKEASARLVRSQQAKKQVEDQLQASQQGSLASNNQRQKLIEESRAHEMEITQQKARISSLSTQLTEAYGLWNTSENSRKASEEKMQARLQEQANQIKQDQTDKILIGIGCGAGGVAAGIIIYEGIKALINLFAGAN